MQVQACRGGETLCLRRAGLASILGSSSFTVERQALAGVGGGSEGRGGGGEKKGKKRIELEEK